MRVKGNIYKGGRCDEKLKGETGGGEIQFMEVIDFLLLTIDKVRAKVIKRTLLPKGNASTEKKNLQNKFSGLGLRKRFSGFRDRGSGNFGNTSHFTVFFVHVPFYLFITPFKLWNPFFFLVGRIFCTDNFIPI